jgi:hypothetical protein
MEDQLCEKMKKEFRYVEMIWIGGTSVVEDVGWYHGRNWLNDDTVDDSAISSQCVFR